MTNREIKFRAWDRLNNKWVYWYVILKAGDEMPMNEVDFEFRGQYTGLKDKKGKEIYFGDILKAHFPGNFVIEEGNYKLLNTLEKKLYSVEVIGNIYENKELL